MNMQIYFSFIYHTPFQSPALTGNLILSYPIRSGLPQLNFLFYALVDCVQIDMIIQNNLKYFLHNKNIIDF